VNTRRIGDVFPPTNEVDNAVTYLSQGSATASPPLEFLLHGTQALGQVEDNRDSCQVHAEIPPQPLDRADAKNGLHAEEQPWAIPPHRFEYAEIDKTCHHVRMQAIRQKIV
jgi:hypothetical protein